MAFVAPTAEVLPGARAAGASRAAASVTSVLASSAAGMTAALLALKAVGLENARSDVKELLRWARVAPQPVWDVLEWLCDAVEFVLHSTSVRATPTQPQH